MSLRTYLLKRVILSVFILWLVATLNFVIFSISIGDPVRFIVDDPTIKPEYKEMLLEQYGWYDPPLIKYTKYMRNMFTFGIVPPYFGWSTHFKRFVSECISWRLLITVSLLGSALIGRIIAGIPTGIFAASRRGHNLDVAAVGTALFTWGVPTFFIQLLAIIVFGRGLRAYGIKLFPTTWNNPNPVWSLEWYKGIAPNLILPILTLVLAGFGSWVLYTRNMLIDALTQDYVVTARAKGLSERTVLYKHAFKSILPPISTMITLSIPGVITGAVITETIFGIEGIGKLYITALQPSIADWGVAQAVLFLFAALVIICNFLADVLYGVLDPRIRVGSRR